MKKLIAMLLTLATLLSAVACASPVDVLANAGKNPLPDIYEQVAPSVVVLGRYSMVWDAKTDTVTKEEDGFGSAVYVKEGGYFLTNYHVIEDCDQLEIIMKDGTTYEAYLIGGDEACDVAVVQVKDDLDLKPIPMASNTNVRVGDIVAVIGTPLDSDAMYNTLTVGVVSGIDRDDADMESSRAVDLIQIDAAINPGNSGGALLNMKGEFIGIPYMKYMYFSYSEEGGQHLEIYENLGFAIPMDVAKPIADALIEKGVFNRPRFGVSVTDNQGPEEPLKNYPPAGLKIETVEKGGSGAKAGLRVGDVITHVNGKRIYTFREYTKIIDKLPTGESFTITIARYFDKNGEALTYPEIMDVKVTLQMID